MATLIFMANQLNIGSLKMHPEQLFELFYQSINEKMNPHFIGRHNKEAQYRFWYERFMFAFHGIRESRDLESWGEAPQMWLAGYREHSKEHSS